MTATQHGRHRLKTRRALVGRHAATAAMVAGAGAAGWLLTMHIVEPAPPATSQDVIVSQPSPEPAAEFSQQEVQWAGQVIAASRDSLTTSTPDGRTTTFRITPQTAQIGAPGVQRFVVVHGVVYDGVPIATAIADQAAVGPDGPPMDYQLPV